MTRTSSTEGRRLGTMTLDQAIAGGSNILVAVLAARVLGVAAFGLFAVVFLVYVTAQVAYRSLVCDPLLVHPDEAAARTGDVLGTGLVLGVLMSALVALGSIAGFVWEPSLGRAMLALAVCMPLLSLQDLGRYVGFATQRPERALTLDLAWLGLLVVAVVVLVVADARSLFWFIAAWAGSGAVAGLLGLVQNRHHRIRPGLAWLRTTWGFSWRYLVSTTSAQVAALAASLAVGLIAGAKALGAVRGAQLLWRPFQTLQFAAIASGIAEVARLESHAEVWRLVRKTTVVTTAGSLINAAVLLVLPDALGRQVLGETWDFTEPLLVPAALQIVCVSLMSGARAGLFGLRAVRKTVLLDVIGSVLLLAAVVIGAFANEALGAMWALALGQGAIATAWWVAFTTHRPDGPDWPSASAAESA